MENTTLRFRFIYIIGEADVNTSIDISLSLSLEYYVRDEMRGRMKHGMKLVGELYASSEL